MSELSSQVNRRLAELHAERNALDDSEKQLRDALESIQMRRHQVQGAIEELRMLMAANQGANNEDMSKMSASQS